MADANYTSPKIRVFQTHDTDLFAAINLKNPTHTLCLKRRMRTIEKAPSVGRKQMIRINTAARRVISVNTTNCQIITTMHNARSVNVPVEPKRKSRTREKCLTCGELAYHRCAHVGKRFIDPLVH